MRREFLEAIVQLLESRDRTVFFSTHILSDVERVADQVIVLSEGRIAADDSLEALRSRFTKVSFVFDHPPSAEMAIPGARRVEQGAREWIAVFDGMDEKGVSSLAEAIGASDVAVLPMTFEDVFVELVGKAEEDVSC